MPELRDYQKQILDKTRHQMSLGNRSVLICSPCGSGKTLLIAHMLKTASEKGIRSWFTVHRIELLNQSIRAFNGEGVSHGIIASGYPEDRTKLVQIASIQTLSRRLKRYEPPSLIIVDESQHIAAKSWNAVYRAFPDAYHIGLSGSPERLDGKGLGEWFSVIVNGPSVSNLIEMGYLSKYRIFCPPGINTDGVHIRMGDFDKKELELVSDKPTITGSAINHYKKYADGKRAIVFCVSIEHSKHVVSQFIESGVKSAHVDGETNDKERENAVRMFESGEISVLSNVGLFGEGLNITSAEVAILLRPSRSRGLFIQQTGRVLRPHPGKSEAIILDHCGLVARHGFPDDDRIWTLAGRESNRRTVEPGKSVKTCPRCFAAQWSGKPVCGFCGLIFEVESREVRQVAGELSEVDRASIAVRRKHEQARAQSLNELIAIGKERGYKPGWAWFVYNSRRNRMVAA